MTVKLIVAISIVAIYCSALHRQKFDRLPNNTKPISYNLHFQTDVHEGRLKFNGTAQIRIRVLEDTDRIVLHAHNYYDVNVNLVDSEKEEEIDNFKYYNIDSNQLTIQVKSTALKLVAGKEYLLKISYYANSPCDQRRGFCLEWYRDEENFDLIPIAFSQLSQGNARRIFPCYDEPAFKTNFTISITHGKNYTALSNMPRKGKPVPGVHGYVTTHFLESPLMSAHHVTVTVSNYENITERVDNTEVRLFFKPKLKKNRLELEVSKKAIVLMNEYFNITFPMPKFDRFNEYGNIRPNAIQENKGVITYIEIDIFDDIIRRNNTPENCQRATTEIASVWFGNLVTPAWWSQNWLSEGISTYYGIKFINLIIPDWNLTIDNHFLWYSADECPLSRSAKCDWEYESVFEKMSSVKGAFIMSILEKILTEEVLRKGLVKYLEKYQYLSVNEDDLFDCLADSTEVSSISSYFNGKESFKKAMKSWTTQRYHPLVTVIRNYKNGTFVLKQKAYKTIDEGDGTELWWIPITFTTSTILDFDNVTTDFIFPGVEEVQINPTEFGKPLESNDWMILNKQQSGLYRVTYDEKNWNLITCALLKDPNVIPEMTKSQMILDLFELFLEGYVNAPVLFNFLSYLKNEASQIPWLAASSVLTQVFKYIENYEDEPKENLKQFVADIISNASRFFNADVSSENFELSPKNEFLFKLACDVEISKCGHIMDYIINKVKSSGYMKTIEEKMGVHSFCYVIKNSNKDTKVIIDQFLASKKNFYMVNFFPCHINKGNLKYLLKRVLENGTIGPQYVSRSIYLAMSEPVSLEAFIELIREWNYEFGTVFLDNVNNAIFNIKTREHRDMILKACREINNNFIPPAFYSLNKKIERNDKIKKNVLYWLEQDPPITNVNC